MKKLLLGLLLVLLAAPAFAQDAKETALQRVLRTGTLRCGYIIYPPLLDKDPKTGAFSGVSYDLMEEMGKQLGIKIEWAEEAGNDTVFSGLSTGRYDAVCINFWAIPSRSRVAMFTDPFYYEGIYAFSRADDQRFDGGRDALNKADVKGVVLEGEASQMVAKEDFPLMQVVTQPGTTGPAVRFMDVADKKADVTFNEITVFNNYNASNPNKIKLLYPTPIRLNQAAFSVAPGESDLLATMNTTMHHMDNLGIINRILDKYDPKRNIYLRLAPQYQVAK